MANRCEIHGRWCLIRPYLDRRQRMVWAAAEAAVIGRGGLKLLASITRISPGAISRRRHRLKLTKKALPGSLSQAPRHRAGRKLSEVKDPGLLPCLEEMLTDEIAGDPMSEQMWVRSSLRNLSTKLKGQGHEACTHTVARLLRKMGYSLKVNKKIRVGTQHPDRDEQFRYIAAVKGRFLEEGLPVISIDTKKKELIGNYKREGKTWSREPMEVSLTLQVMHDVWQCRLAFTMYVKMQDTLL